MIENLTPAEYETLLRQDFSTFAARCFYDLNPQTELAMNWHLEVIAAKLTASRWGASGRFRTTVAAEGFSFTVRVTEPLGPHIMLTGETVGQQVRVVVPPDRPAQVGETLHLHPRSGRIVWMDPASGVAIARDEARNLGLSAAGN